MRAVVNLDRATLNFRGANKKLLKVESNTFFVHVSFPKYEIQRIEL